VSAIEDGLVVESVFDSGSSKEDRDDERLKRFI
jgi:hypothetical protein